MTHVCNGNASDTVSRSQLEIVVAHYQEDLLWLTPEADKVTVYSKGGPDFQAASFARHIALPNIGRESHTYLYHIVNNYNQLADITLFTQGQVADHVGLGVDITQMLKFCREHPSEPFIAYTKHGLQNFGSWSGILHVKKWKAEKESGVMRTASDTPSTFWKWVFGTDPPNGIMCIWGAIFAVHREAIQQREREFYERILKFFESINHVNPEEGHYVERFWPSIFVPNVVSVPVMSCLSEMADMGKQDVNDEKRELPNSSVLPSIRAKSIDPDSIWAPIQIGPIQSGVEIGSD